MLRPASQVTEREQQQTPKWWRDMALYQTNLPTFRDGNHDGIGDLRGLIESLDYVADLGVTAIWTGPFYTSPLLDNGYDITDHCAVDPRFGDLTTVDLLISEAHRRGLRIVIDYVPNHTSHQHPWFLESRSSRDNPRRDWYVWADAAPGKPFPNNWAGEFTGSMWELDERTGQFYLHSHLKEQPDLNWRNPEVRAAMHDVLRFWLDRGVDGIRVDVAHLLMKDPELRDNPPNPHGRNIYELRHAEYDSQLHVNDRMHPDLHEVLRGIRALVDEYDGDRVTIGEIEGMDWDPWSRYYGSALDELHLPFAFKVIETPWEATALAAVLAELDRAVPDGAWPILALGNHDRPRLATRIGPEQARIAAVLLLTLRGTPTLYYGDELGMTDQPVPAEARRDAAGEADEGAGRDQLRTPMPWNDGHNGGFSTATQSELWLPISDKYLEINVEAQRADERSIFNLYRRLLRLRSDRPVLREGTWDLHPASNGACLVYTRSLAGEQIAVGLNFTAEPQRVDLGGSGTVLLSTALDQAGEATDAAMKLRPHEGAIIELDSQEAA